MVITSALTKVDWLGIDWTGVDRLAITKSEIMVNLDMLHGIVDSFPRQFGLKVTKLEDLDTGIRYSSDKLPDDETLGELGVQCDLELPDRCHDIRLTLWIQKTRLIAYLGFVDIHDYRACSKCLNRSYGQHFFQIAILITSWLSNTS
jgi:hypothetical protein